MDGRGEDACRRDRSDAVGLGLGLVMGVVWVGWIEIDGTVESSGGWQDGVGV